MTSPEATLAELKRGIVDLVSEVELLERLREGKPLRVKAGFDPTRPDLHLGHVVLMNKMRQFQELGHHVIFIVGDFTAQVGDPTGRNKARPPLSPEQILEGARTYAEQAFKVLDRTRTEIRYNSEWLGKLTPQDFIRLAARRTVERTLERSDFGKRFAEHKPIWLHELLYPLLQGYDSVAIDADIELGGTDQLFNLNVGRDLMTTYTKRAQIVMTTPLLEGTDARWIDGHIVGEKMSKSAENYIGVDEQPLEMFRKIMLIDDGVIWRYFELLSTKSQAEIADLRQQVQKGSTAPREAQRQFAREIVGRFHSERAAREAENQYDENSRGGFPPDAPKFDFNRDPARGTLWLARALTDANLALNAKGQASTSEARRLIAGGAVQIDGQKVTDEQYQLAPSRAYAIVVGGKNKRYARIHVH